MPYFARVSIWCVSKKVGGLWMVESVKGRSTDSLIPEVLKTWIRRVIESEKGWVVESEIGWGEGLQELEVVQLGWTANE